MQTYETAFEPFLSGKTVLEYCRSAVEPNGSEIEHCSIQALSDFLLKPAGIRLEVFYLDRSPGEEAHNHKFGATATERRRLSDLPVIRLLYRP